MGMPTFFGMANRAAGESQFDITAAPSMHAGYFQSQPLTSWEQFARKLSGWKFFAYLNDEIRDELEALAKSTAIIVTREAAAGDTEAVRLYFWMEVWASVNLYCLEFARDPADSRRLNPADIKVWHMGVKGADHADESEEEDDEEAAKPYRPHFERHNAGDRSGWQLLSWRQMCAHDSRQAQLVDSLTNTERVGLMRRLGMF